MFDEKAELAAEYHELYSPANSTSATAKRMFC